MEILFGVSLVLNVMTIGIIIGIFIFAKKALDAARKRRG